jgi:hypothetical protein
MTKKQVGKERVYSVYTSTLLLITKGSKDWNSSRSWKQELMQRPWRIFFFFLLACFPWLAQLALLSQDYQPSDGTTHNEPYPLDHQLKKNAPQALTQLKLFSVITPACVKLTHKTSQ